MGSSPSSAIRSNAQTIADRLHEYEDLLRATHVAGLRLAIDLHTIQDIAGLNSVTGHALFGKIDEAQLKLSGALTNAAEGHLLARAVAKRIGIDPASVGEKTVDDDEIWRLTGADRLPAAA